MDREADRGVPNWEQAGIRRHGARISRIARRWRSLPRRWSSRLCAAAATSAMLRRRFDQERRIHAGLRHPGIAQWVDAGVLDNHPFMLLEHVVGELHRRPLRAQAPGSAVAHRAGVAGLLGGPIRPGAGGRSIGTSSQPMCSRRPKARRSSWISASPKCFRPTSERPARPCCSSRARRCSLPRARRRSNSRTIRSRWPPMSTGLGHLLYRLATGHLPHQGHRRRAHPGVAACGSASMTRSVRVR